MPNSTANFNILFNSIMDNCLDIITVKDLDGRYLACNRAFLDIIGVESEEYIIGKCVDEILSYKNRKPVIDALNVVLKTGKPQSFTFEIKTSKFNKIIQQTSTPIVENGKITRILAVARDVTHEENLKLKLTDKITQLNTLLEHLPMLVYMKNKNREFITGSKHAKEFVQTGLDRYAGNVKIDKDYNSAIVEQEDRYVLETKQLLIKEQKTKSTAGEDLWYKVYKAPIKKAENDVNGIVTIIQNINSEKYLEAQKELFLATLTHDLKNPVQAQLMSLKMLRNESFGSLNLEQKELLDMILESTNYMQEMLKSLLTTYKFENGVITLEKEYFYAEELTQSCINEVTAFAKNKNVKIVSDFNTQGRKLLADTQQLRRVIGNILNNALNYSYKNTELKITVENNNKYMVFAFENTSPEIPESIRTQIFDKYVTGAKSFKLTGIGLGLYFSKKVVDAHNGKIYLYAKGERNKFVFEIPLVDENINTTISW